MSLKPALHGRDHCPGGADEIPCLSSGQWARISKGFDASNQLIPNTSFEVVTTNHSYNMGAGESGEAYFDDGTANKIEILQNGIYQITCECYWFDAVGSTWMFGWDEVPASAWLHMSTFDGTTSTTVTGVVSGIWRIETGAKVNMNIWQSTGGNRNLDAAYLEIVRLGSYTGTDRLDMNPNQ